MEPAGGRDRDPAVAGGARSGDADGDGAALLAPALAAGVTDEATAPEVGRLVALVAAETPAAVAPLADRLAARLADDPSEPVARGLATLAVAHDATVREALLDATGRAHARVLYEAVAEADPWPRPDSAADGGADRVFRRLVRTLDRPGTESESEEASQGAADEPASAPEEGSEGSAALARRAARIREAQQSRAFRAIARRSGFTDLQVVAPETERRYASVLRARGRRDGGEHGLAVRLFRAPDAAGEAVADRVGAWAAVDHEGVVTVADHGRRPRPWAITEYVGETLAGRGRLPPEQALSHARRLAAGLAALHQHGVVHGGVDPTNVVYAADAIDRPAPMLDNVGLVAAYREPFDPADYLDPRYAAPEYFDSRFGALDGATDVYGLGATLYRAVTGHPPFEGSYADIRRQVLRDRPPAPSRVADVPAGLDEVIAKATAKQKLTRYETAERLYRDVCRVCERSGRG